MPVGGLSVLGLPEEFETIRQERLARAKAVYANPDSPTIMAEHIAENGNLSGLAELWDVTEYQLTAWMLRHHKQDLVDAKTQFIMTRVQSLAEADMSKCFDDNNDIKPIKDWPEDCKKALQSIKTANIEGKTVIQDFKLADKLKAQELSGRQLGAFTDKVESVSHSLIQVVIGATDSEYFDKLETPAAIEVPAEVVEETKPPEEPMPEAV